MTRLPLVMAWFVASSVFAQFTPDLLQNSHYWSDGKAEFNIYDARIVRDGIPRACEVVHILVRELCDAKQPDRSTATSPSPSVAILKLNQVLHIPSGLSVCQQMHSSYWRVDNAQLLKCSLTGNDGVGNTFKEIRRENDQLKYEFHTSCGGSGEGKENIAPPPGSYFYDELPLVVRTLNFSKPADKIEVQLAGSIINSRRDAIIFKPARISFKPTEKTIEVSVDHAAGVDRFVLDRDDPHLLRQWTAADGSQMKLKRNLKVDYQNYTKPGDRERALSNPMLRLPD